MKRTHLLALVGLFLAKLLFISYSNYLLKTERADLRNGIGLFFLAVSGDTPSYIEPWENLIEHGTYSMDGTKPYVDRVPFVGLPYFILRFLFDRKTSFEIIVIFQILLSSISSLYMAFLCKRVCEIKIRNSSINSDLAFYIYIILSFSAGYISSIDSTILSDSISNSAFGLFIYQYYQYLCNNRSNRRLLLSGIFLAISSLWRPYIVVLYVIVILEILYFYISNRLYLTQIISKVTILLSPFLIVDIPWLIRNLLIFREIIPFQRDIYVGYRPGYIAYIQFAKTIGGSIAYWDPRSFGCYFDLQVLPCSFDPKSLPTGTNLTMEKIEKGRLLFRYYKENQNDILLEKLTVSYFNYLSECHKKDFPMTHWLRASLRSAKSFIVHSGAFYFPMSKNTKNYNPVAYYTVKGSLSLTYWMLIIFGSVGSIYIFFIDKKLYFIPTIIVYLIIFFSFVIRLDEARYFIHAYWSLIAGCTLIIWCFMDYFNRKWLRSKYRNPT
jgi:hypothetical protein